MVLYKEIAQDIRSKIINGTYPVGDPIPEQIKLAKDYNTSRVTIQKAIDILKSEGLIFSRPGSGTFVKKSANVFSSLDNDIDVYEGVTASFGSMGLITSEILNFSVRFPTDDEIENLLITKSTPVYDILRLRFLNNEPLILEYTIMPVYVIPNITEETLYGSIYSHIQQNLSLKIGLANRKIHADKPNTLDQKYLNCQLTDPILEVEQVVYLDTGTPFEYSKTRRRYDKGSILMIQKSK